MERGGGNEDDEEELMINTQGKRSLLGENSPRIGRGVIQ
jgi:hypothetical protein